MLGIGETAPDFTLHDHRGGRVSLGDLLARGPLVLYFYPADFTPVCTAEACMFRDAHADLAEAGVTIAGVSPQGTDTHAKFADKHKLPFPLLADKDKAVVKAYRANGPFGLGVRRVTYLIGADRRIMDAVRADLGVGRHRAFVKRAIEALGEARASDA